MRILKCAAVAAALFVTDAALSATADAQCDPGMLVNDIMQSNARVGFVARTEGPGAGYTEHWCLLPTFKNFGARDAAPTAFRGTAMTFNAGSFTDLCRRERGAYHVATVVVQRL